MALAIPYRVRARKDFDAIFQGGRTIRDSHVFLKYQPSSQEHCRFGFVVSAKVAPRAVDRNKIKRTLAIQAQDFLSRQKAGFDVIVIVTNGKDVGEIRKSFQNLLSKLARPS